jgi:hypothetical protein
MPKWKAKKRDAYGGLVWADSLHYVNRDLCPNSWLKVQRAKILCHLLARPAVRWATQHYLKDPDSNPLPLSAKRLTASEFEYYQ